MGGAFSDNKQQKTVINSSLLEKTKYNVSINSNINKLTVNSILLEETKYNVSIDSNINEFFMITSVTKIYKNETDNPFEINVIIPIKKEVQFSKFKVELNNKIIISKILDKEKAEEKFSDAVAKGNLGIKSSYKEDNYSYILNIGNLNPKSEVKIISEFIQFLTNDDLSYSFSLMNYYLFSDYDNLKYNININTHSKITRLIYKNLKENIIENSLKIKFNENQTNCNLNFIMKFNNKNEEINILFRTEKMNEKLLLKQYNPKLDETNYIMNMIYNPMEIPKKENIDFDENINYFDKYGLNQINDNPSLFIFLIDQSYSMSGKPIELVHESLLFFLHSLPNNSYFQLIGFGTRYKKINNIPLKYNKENVELTEKLIKDLSADLGGTNISDPLKDIFNSNDYDNIKLSKNLLILTDGEVDNSEECLNLISNNNEQFKIHSIGIGDSFDEYLIKKAGVYGKGSFNYVTNINDINSVIIQNLNKCLKPYLIDTNFNLISDKVEYQFIPKDIVYQDETLNYSFIKKGKFDNENIKINFDSIEYNNNNKNNIREEITFSNNDIIKIPDGDIISKIIIGNILKKNNNNEEKEISLSKKYQILSKKTSLFAEIENESQIIGELKKINLNEINIQKNYSENNDKDDSSSEDYDNECAIDGLTKDEEVINDKQNIKYKKNNSVSEENDNECAIDDLGCEVNCEKDLPYESKGNYNENYEETKKYNNNNLNNKNENNFNNNNNKNYSNVKAMALSQDICDGFWELNNYTQYFIDNNKDLFNKIQKIFSDRNNDDKNIIITFFIVYYLKNDKAINQIEFMLICNKAIKFLKKYNIEYYEIAKNL